MTMTLTGDVVAMLLRRCKLGERKMDEKVSPVPWSIAPHVCPVCDGRGEVRKGFYLPRPAWTESTTAIFTEKCRTCQGRGVVWKP